MLLARGIARVASARLSNGMARQFSDVSRSRGGRTTPFGSYGGLAPEVEAADLSRDSLSKLGVSSADSPVYEQFTEVNSLATHPRPPPAPPARSRFSHLPPSPLTFPPLRSGRRA